MNTYTSHKHKIRSISAAAIISLSTYCGVATNSAQASSQPPPSDQELRQTIMGLEIEGLSLSLTPAQAHEKLVATDFQVHKGTEPGHGIYWKNESETLTKRLRLKSSEERIYQIQFSFAERDGDQAWRQLFNEIKTKLGTSTRLCKKATEHELDCVLVSESSTQLSAEITAMKSEKANRIRVRLDQRTGKINIKSNLSFGSPKKP